MMERYKGKAVAGGVAIGTALVLIKEEREITLIRVADAEAEVARYESAEREAIEQLRVLYERAQKELGDAAEIFDVHIMMLEDEDYRESILGIIRGQSANAEYAVSETGKEFAESFSQMEDEYFKARALDVKDITERLLVCLAGDAVRGISDEPVIVMATDLAPSETVQMDRAKLLGFVTELGSANSHTAILARTMGIPALGGIAPRMEWDGKRVIVDGATGDLYIEPDAQLLRRMEHKQAEERAQAQALAELKGKPDITRSGKTVELCANIGKVADADAALANDAQGIGLFRSEFLYLAQDRYPTEDEQFAAYRAVAEKMEGKRVVIRTLDIGADKQAEYFGLGHEDNPAMGYRAIRICLERTEVFKTQLRALLRASAYGNIAIMYPMIISVDEVRRAKAIAEEVKRGLDDEGVAYNKAVEQGIMIETPAAVMISDELAREVDFFSIGTNDLTQYTLAIDRQNPRLDNIYDAHHPAILRMLRMVAENGHSGGCWVGICGELAADTALTQFFVDIGIDELSVSPAFVLKVRKAIREAE